ncbi:MAG: circularly permuted type 2 ATP-grasp protein [Hyphomicrobiaceae bacterium]|nr:circularly permuted type 2 ATP-grasp protein [Hyphomicrobiaceae bacterium]
MPSSNEPLRCSEPAPESAGLADYDPGVFYCELFGRERRPAANLKRIWQKLTSLGLATLRQRASEAENELFNLGITFTVYTDKSAIDRILPFDIVPRIIDAPTWAILERGVVQRVAALNLFLWDIYHEQKILKDGVIPADLVLKNPNYRPEMVGLDPPCGTYIHINGTDIIRDHDGAFLVLEDNGRAPSGVSYVVENRHLMQRAFPDLMDGLRVRNVSDYGERLRGKLAEVAPAGVDNPVIVLLSPGVFNSAYFEHIFLAREMGVPLVEGRDLVVDNDRVYMKTIAGLERVDVIYRRINDDFLDPEAFNAESMLGVAGLMRAARKGTVTLANAVGTGVADDKAVYAYVPRIIKYYLDEEPILANVETHICREKEGLAYTLDNLDKLVVKPVGESGGYGIVVGPKATKSELAEVRKRLIEDPANYISQPMINLSVCPTLTDKGLAPRHIDLRPYAITGRDTWVLPGGLTRVALREGSIIVNSSQGGGTKDTWVLQSGIGNGAAHRQSQSQSQSHGGGSQSQSQGLGQTEGQSQIQSQSQGQSQTMGGPEAGPA